MCILTYTHHIAENLPPIISCMTSAVNLSKRTEEIKLLFMGEEITLREKKRQGCWSLPKMNAREKTVEGLAAEG